MDKTTEKNDLAPYLFHQGTNFHSYEYFGVHKNDNGYVFRVWAPNAESVYLVGDFNGWDESAPMHLTDGEIWETELLYDVFGEGSKYKYKIKGNGREFFKADPYAVYSEVPPLTASRYYESKFRWKDGGWMKFRKKNCKDRFSQPLNIYELHVGSWKKHEDGSPLNYRELAIQLVPYVKKMGYTHVELMPVSEHPFDGSWGYQVTGYYAVSARWGDPDDLKYFIDSMHRSGVGVILDWVPAHFCKDEHGLMEFDGKPLYEYQGKDRQEHEGWGTRRFDVGREEVQCFLVSNAVYWAEQFHVDGLRVDAVASMLYLDYDKKPGEWVPNVYGDNRCLEAIAFFKKLNAEMAREYPDVMMIAEESTAFANVTGNVSDGLGFTYKWNMGWMNDTLSYAVTDPLFRGYESDHAKLTFPIVYSFSEKFILPVSHDEVVHGKKSLLDKMPGDYEMKFQGTRLFAAYRMLFPGKKLMFMGEEIGQFREWDYEGSVEWFLLQYPAHAALQHYYCDLNHFYLAHKQLYELDCTYDGFEWIYADMREISVTAFRRKAKDGSELIAVLNYTPVTRDGFYLRLPESGCYREVFNTDRPEYGGSGILNRGVFITDSNNSINITVPPLGVTVFEKEKTDQN